MFRNIIIVLLLFFLTVVHSEYRQTIVLNIRVHVHSPTKLACIQSGRADLVQGDKLEILANVSSPIDYMWCKDLKINQTQVSRCNYTSSNYLCTSVATSVGESQNWTCEFLIRRNDKSINTTRNMDGHEYNYAVCNLQINVQRRLWFSGMDPNRRRISYETQNKINYEYSYKPGEKLNIGCEQYGQGTRHFSFSDATSRLSASINSRFEREATVAMDSSTLSCHFNDATGPIIKAYLRLDQHDTLWFTGLDYHRVTTTTAQGVTNYVYKYKLNENLKIGCNTERDDLEKNFQFIDVNAPRKINSLSQFELSSANQTLNGSRLICIIKNAGSTVIVYSLNLDFVLDSTDPNTTDVPVFYTQEHKIEPTDGATADALDNSKFNWNTVTIAVAVVGLLCVTALCVVLGFRRKKILAAKETSKSLLNNDLTPTITENPYTETKDPNYVGGTVYSYADVGRRRLVFGPEETCRAMYTEPRDATYEEPSQTMYAEPSQTTCALPCNTTIELYTLPTPKSQRVSKTDEKNYTNVFGQHYVNSKK